MKRYIARQVVIARLAALALIALCFLQVPVRAQGVTGYIVLFPSVGLAPGQTLRLTLFNPGGAPVRAQAQIHHSGGVLVGLGDGSVRANAFHSFDFNRGDIPLAGEAGTGRLQLRASCYIRMAEPPKKIDRLVVTMETISISDGASNTILVSQTIHYSHTGGAGNDLLNSGLGNDIPMGIVPAQTLRVTLFNPPSSGSEVQQNPVTGRLKVLDGSGHLIAQSHELVIPPGEFRSFDFDRNALPSPGETGTDRLQVRIKPSFDFRSERHSGVLTSFEIVNNRTGKTEVLSGQQCLIFSLGGTGN
jgi:hypothetical protein